MNYKDFVSKKLTTSPNVGIMVDESSLNETLFPHQRALVLWALRHGRSAIFADTGLGKTAMQLEWTKHVQAHTNGTLLILAPLAVASQTVKEGERMGVAIHKVRERADLVEGAINIVNYDRLHKLTECRVDGVVLDESSIIKHHDAKTLKQVMDVFAHTPYKLCATATPAPNDFVELGTHAEFLGVCTQSEMLSEFFCHDGGETQSWRLKGHAKTAFWKWLSTWGALVRNPSDLGFDGTAYELPGLTVHEHVAQADVMSARNAGLLFPMPANTLTERRAAKKGSLTDRVRMCAELVNASEGPWVVWCELNSESEALADAIRDSVEVRGSMTSDEKEKALDDFAQRGKKVLISKPSICGFGLNWQHCADMAFVGVSDSWEKYYQSVRRCYRFGQKRHVNVYIFSSDLEGNVVANLKRKEADAKTMAEELSKHTRDAVALEVLGQKRITNEYAPKKKITIPSWLTTLNT